MVSTFASVRNLGTKINGCYNDSQLTSRNALIIPLILYLCNRLEDWKAEGTSAHTLVPSMFYLANKNLLSCIPQYVVPWPKQFPRWCRDGALENTCAFVVPYIQLRIMLS